MKVLLSTGVQVAYGTDVRALRPRWPGGGRGAARAGRPAPSCQLAGFAADGVDLTINWIADPENGRGGNVRSDVNLAVATSSSSSAGHRDSRSRRVMHPSAPAHSAGKAGRVRFVRALAAALALALAGCAARRT